MKFRDNPTGGRYWVTLRQAWVSHTAVFSSSYISWLLTTQKSIILIFTSLQVSDLIYEHLCFCKFAQCYCVGRNNSTCYNNHLSVIVVPFCACRWNVKQCTACRGWSSTENTRSLQSIIQHPQYSVGRIGKGNNSAQKYIFSSYSNMTCTWQATVSCDFDFCQFDMMSNI